MYLLTFSHLSLSTFPYFSTVTCFHFLIFPHFPTICSQYPPTFPSYCPPTISSASLTFLLHWPTSTFSSLSFPNLSTTFCDCSLSSYVLTNFPFLPPFPFTPFHLSTALPYFVIIFRLSATSTTFPLCTFPLFFLYLLTAFPRFVMIFPLFLLFHFSTLLKK